MLRTATLLLGYVFIWNLNWKTTSSVTALKFIIYWLPVESKENLKTLVPGKVPSLFLDYQNNLALSYFCVKVRLVSGLLPHDYVAAFFKDVKRAKVLRAKTIMLSPEKNTS